MPNPTVNTINAKLNFCGSNGINIIPIKTIDNAAKQ
jgi:hypothetical protein